MRITLTYLGTTGTTAPPNNGGDVSISTSQTVVMDKPNKKHFDYAVGHQIPIERPRTTVGRVEGNTIRLGKCPAVSGQHGSFLLGGTNLRYEDTSRNGTSIDGEILHQSTGVLRNGTILSFPADKYNPRGGSAEAWLHFAVSIKGKASADSDYDEGPTTEVGGGS